MARSRKLEIVLTGDSASAERAFRSTSGAAGSFEQRMGGVGRAVNNTGGLMGRFGTRMRRFGDSAMNAGQSMTRGLTLPLLGWGYLAFQELSEGQEAMNQTRAAIESTGGAADRSAPQIARLAAELSELSSMDDEDLQGALNVLLTFTNVSGEVFDEASLQIANVSARMGTDLPAAALQVGKALNNPIKGMTALTRIGVNFDDQFRNTGYTMAEAIEWMVEMGDTAGAQRIILQELNNEFGGSAEAFGRGPAADMRRLKMRFEELGASILTNLMPVLEDFAGVVEGLADKYDNLSTGQQKWVAGLLGVLFIAGPLTTVVGGLSKAVGLLAAGASRAGVAMGIAGGWVAVLIIAFAALAVGIYVLVTNWDKVSMAFKSVFNLIVSSVPGMRTMVDGFGAAIRGVVGAVSWLVSGLKGLAGLTFQGLITAIGGIGRALDTVLSIAHSLIDTIGAIASAIANLDLSAAANALPGVGRVVSERAVAPVTRPTIVAATPGVTNGTVRPISATPSHAGMSEAAMMRVNRKAFSQALNDWAPDGITVLAPRRGGRAA